MINEMRRIGGSILRRLRPDPDRFLKDVTGVIHVGANLGQEREQYAARDLDVIWIEPIPDVFRKLEANLRAFPRQSALQYLLSDREGAVCTLNIASNGGASSSIYEFGLHSDIWPDVRYVDRIELTSRTLASVVAEHAIDPGRYQALVMDTQGSELLILKGAEALLPRFRYIKTEAPDFEAYRGCCLIDELSGYLDARGFAEIARHEIGHGKDSGSYFDVVYRRRDA